MQSDQSYSPLRTKSVKLRKSVKWAGKTLINANRCVQCSETLMITNVVREVFWSLAQLIVTYHERGTKWVISIFLNIDNNFIA